MAQLFGIAYATSQMAAAVSGSTVTVRVPVGTCPLSSSAIIVPFTTLDAYGNPVTGASTSYSPVFPSLKATPTPSLSAVLVPITTVDASGNPITTLGTSFSPVYPPPTGLPTPSQSAIVVQVSGTDASGNPITTPSTSLVLLQPPPTLSAVVVPITGTDASGNLFTTPSTLLVPVSPTGLPAASGTTPVTTPAGPISSSSSATPSGKPIGAGVAYPCPTGLDQPYADSKGNAYTLFCNTDFLGQDLPSLNISIYSECIDACANYKPPPSGSFSKPCVAVTWTATNRLGNNCYLKSGIQNVVYGSSQYNSAKVLSYAPAFGALSVSVVTPSATINTFQISTTFPSYQAPSPCPLANDTTYQKNTLSVPYVVQCGLVYEGSDLPAAYTNSFEQCMLACSSYVPAASG